MRTLDMLAGYRENSLTIAPAGADPVRVTGALVTLDYFDIFGSAPLLGRAFSRASDTGTSEPLAVLGAKAWRETTAFGPRDHRQATAHQWCCAQDCRNDAGHL